MLLMSKEELVFDYQPYVQTIVELKSNQVSNVEVEKDTIKLIYEDNRTTVILSDGTKAHAKCSPEDNFDEDIGKDIAFYRAFIKQYKKKIKQLSK
jgi:hypothetical protein